VDAPVDLDALAREARALAVPALAWNADLADALCRGVALMAAISAPSARR
jgi:hypothetical protein